MSDRKTIVGATETTDGLIPHYLYNGILCPVKLIRNGDNGGYIEYKFIDGKKLPVPMYKDERLVFVLPNGKEIAPVMGAVFSRAWSDM